MKTDILYNCFGLIEEEVYENGDDISIGGQRQFKQVTIKNENDNEFKILSFRPVASMNYES